MPSEKNDSPEASIKFHHWKSVRQVWVVPVNCLAINKDVHTI